MAKSPAALLKAPDNGRKTIDDNRWTGRNRQSGDGGEDREVLAPEGLPVKRHTGATGSQRASRSEKVKGQNRIRH